LKKDNETFYQWADAKNRYGVNFAEEDKAAEFEKHFREILDKLSSGKGNDFRIFPLSIFSILVSIKKSCAVPHRNISHLPSRYFAIAFSWYRTQTRAGPIRAEISSGPSGDSQSSSPDSKTESRARW